MRHAGSRSRFELLHALAAGLSLLAGLIHLWVAPEHFGEALGSGLFMVIAGGFQIVTGLLLILHPSRLLILVMVAGTLAVLFIFAVAYTVGLPVGPMPGKPEELGSAVIISKLTELTLLGALLLLLRHAADRTARPAKHAPIEHSK